jgi:hypothetical protein
VRRANASGGLLSEIAMSGVVLFTRPGLAELVERVRANLSDEGRRTLDAHITQAERVASDAFDGLTPWRLTGSDVLWFRAGDYAGASDMTPQAARKHVDHMLRRGELTEADIRRNVTNAALDANYNPGLSLTDSPRGVLMLSPRALLILSQRSDSARGMALRSALVRLMEHSSQTEHLLVSMVTAENERLQQREPDTSAAAIQLAALHAMRAAFTAGRTRIPRDLQALACGRPLVDRTPRRQVADNRPAEVVDDVDPEEHEAGPIYHEGYPVHGLKEVARSLAIPYQRVRALMEKHGMWGNPAWHATTWVLVHIENGRTRQEPRHSFRAGVGLELAGRMKQADLFRDKPKQDDEEH